ncbi:MAG: hypothetical protein HOM30_03805 [Gammaproteobacteria bacterium]|jgi:hypothetical protein|nr:hypothetical protein [Gammaproteobacteria bacterium]MBT4462292.1 hypothetical protein [Gammaproteobacteria bacterium]MBT4655219.1 hypothetical protein [Gammaproteobacteria bacterium]MBT5117002.1 hypothetical protein [Gammaproteobacteria bacterium]MBT7323109.1 hypothetical protein [Gammaproteobacteria bacterium]
MKDTPNKKPLKNYELSLTTWNKGRLGKYQLLRKINKKAFKRSLNATQK